MSAQPKQFITPQEYLCRERLAEFKSEYFNGEMFAMAGAKGNHVRVNTNLSICLGIAFRGGPCYPLSNDMRVKVSATGLYTYSDQIVLCDEMQLEDDDVLLNPKIIFEVLSPSTERYDRGGKFEHYRTIPTLMEYLLISQIKPYIEQFVRQPDGRWLMTACSGIDAVLTLSTVPASMKLGDLYKGVRFPQLTIYDEPAEPAS